MILLRLNRIAPRVQNLNLNFAFSLTKKNITCVSNIHRTHLSKIWQPILAQSPAGIRQLSISVQYRVKQTACDTRLEKFLLPDIGEGISEVVIKGWQVKVGDVVKQFDPICEVESDKATATISSRYDGTVRSVHYDVGDMAKVGKPLVDIEVLGSPIAEESSVGPKQESGRAEAAGDAGDANGSVRVRSSEIDKPKTIIPALPSVRRFAQEMNVDLALIKATGSRGQILKDDVLAYLNSNSKAKEQTYSSSTEEPPTSAVEQQQVPSPVSQSTSLIPLRGIQKAMFRTMTESLKIPHFNYADEIDLSELIEARSALQGSETKKISNFAFIVKMVSLALHEYPQLNASIDGSGENLIHKHYHNIGVAVDTQAGLIVPNIKNVQDLSVEEVNIELIRLRELGYSSKLGLADLSGATITLSNIGAVGGTFGVPVIVSPEIVIGALGRTQKLPRFNSQGQIEARHILQVVWSADHRVVDGATLSRFSNLLKQYLESPHSALLKLK